MISLAGHILSILGSGFVIASYALLTTGKLDSTDIQYHACNLFGALLLLISLFIHFNLGNVIIEIFWIAISIIGLIKKKE